MSKPLSFDQTVKCIVNLLRLLIRSVVSLCSLIGSLVLFVFASEKPSAEESNDLDDGLSLMEREEEASISGWKTW